jgi:hypothetical protein
LLESKFPLNFELWLNFEFWLEFKFLVNIELRLKYQLLRKCELWLNSEVLLGYALFINGSNKVIKLFDKRPEDRKEFVAEEENEQLLLKRMI